MRDSEFLGHCLVEGDPSVSRQFRRSRLRALATSISLQGALVTATVLLPLLATAKFPDLTAPPSVLYVGTYKVPPANTGQSVKSQRSKPVRPIPPPKIFVPTPNPHRTSDRQDEDSSAGALLCPNCVPSDRDTVGDPNAPSNSISALFSNNRPIPSPMRPVPQNPPSQLQRVQRHQSVLQAQLIHRVEPTYTPILRAMRRQGTVLIRALVGTNGCIREVRVESGDPALAEEAMRAIRQWRYRPTLLNGVPVEVEIIITVKFKLSQ